MGFPNDIYQFFSDYIFKNTGILYTEDNYYQLDMRIEKFMDILQYDDAKKCVDGVLPF